MARTRGGEKRKTAPRNKAAAEFSSQQLLWDEGIEDAAIHEEEVDVEVTPASGGNVTAQPSSPATSVDKIVKEPTESRVLEKDEEEARGDESPLRKRHQ